MKLLHRTFVLRLSACALTAMSLSAWGAPLSEISATPMPLIQEPQTQPQDQAKPDDVKPMTFTGTVVKQGDRYVLRDSSGAVYQLDDSARAQQFEGKTVTVSGKLDAQTKTIHVDSIQGAGA